MLLGSALTSKLHVSCTLRAETDRVERETQNGTRDLVDIGAFKGNSSPVADGLDLVGEVLAAGRSRVEVRLDEHAEAAAHDAVAVATLHRGGHARHALVRNTLHQSNIEPDFVPFYDLWTEIEKANVSVCD